MASVISVLAKVSADASGFVGGMQSATTAAKKLETAVKEGKSDEELLDIAKNDRTNTFTGDWAKATTRVNSLIDKTSGMS